MESLSYPRMLLFSDLYDMTDEQSAQAISDATSKNMDVMMTLAFIAKYFQTGQYATMAAILRHNRIKPIMNLGSLNALGDVVDGMNVGAASYIIEHMSDYNDNYDKILEILVINAGLYSLDMQKYLSICIRLAVEQRKKGMAVYLAHACGRVKNRLDTNIEWTEIVGGLRIDGVVFEDTMYGLVLTSFVEYSLQKSVGNKAIEYYVSWVQSSRPDFTIFMMCEIRDLVKARDMGIDVWIKRQVNRWFKCSSDEDRLHIMAEFGSDARATIEEFVRISELGVGDVSRLCPDLVLDIVGSMLSEANKSSIQKNL